ncbi:PAS domain-containing response regulator [Halogeometricum limi]|uniref:PAS domain S-box-containing protein n=1 Tax=Halogeometricum limi TaxID=555875 RepID=A0A1I6H839_9EURY|nr:PAS domain-containing protein [Halogeometricum limi]SFR50635.1 PAS domain S-box-containing protein [Halogeometricum limi]
MNGHDPDVEADVGVLFVDDDRAFVDAAATFVGRHLPRARTYTAESPAEAREFMEANADDVDCIVSDYEMTHETGIDFLRSVRADYPDLPFILFTGKGSEEVAGDAFRAGATDYLKKEMGTDQFEVLARRIEQSITASRATREAARNRKLLDAAIEAMEDVFYVFDTSGRFLHWNQALVDQTGYTDEEIAAMHPTEFFGDADAERIAEAIATVLDGDDVTIEATVQTNDGNARAYEFTGSLLVDGEGEPFGICGVGRDRSNRAHIDELERILDRLGVPMFGISGDGTLDYVSGTRERLGIDETDVGESVWNVLPWDEQSEFGTAIRKGIEAGISTQVPVTLPDGSSALATCNPSSTTVSVRVYLTGLD